MSTENVRKRKGNPRYTVVLVPDGETKRPWTISFTRWGALAVLSGALLVVVSLVVSALIYTPIGARLSIARSDLEQRYGKQIAGMQEQLQSLVKEMTVLRAYSLRLRTALGEKMGGGDSSVLQAATSSPADIREPAAAAAAAAAAGDDPSVSPPSQAVDGDNLRQTGGGRGTGGEEERFASRQPSVAGYPLLVAPADGFITRGFDPRQFHYGTDFAGKVGSVVRAAADGNVIFAGWTYDDGYTMLVTHGRGIMTAYKHNEALLKFTGVAVRRGEAIALLGNTGRTSSGPHLHFEVWKDGVPQDPAEYVVSIQ